MKSITVTGVDVFLKPSTKALSLGFSILLLRIFEFEQQKKTFQGAGKP